MGIRGNKKGVSLIAAIFMIVILAFMGVMFLTLFTTSSFTSINDLQSAQALYVAEGGLESAVISLNTSTLGNRIACANVTDDANLTDEPLGQGQFTVTADAGTPFYPANAATLAAGGITSTDTTINTNAAPAGYASSGRIMIDRELIDYSGISGSSFVGAVRGRDGTTAVSHAQNTRVGQYQCSVTSAGGIPAVASLTAKRTVKEGIQLQEGWAVGNNGVILRWNGTTWSLFVTTGTPLRSVSMDSYANGWMVGDLWPQAGTDYAQIRRLNPDGTPGWDLVGAPVEATVQLNSVHVLSHNEAWAVGNDRVGGSDTLIIHWNGANWIYTDPAGNFDQNLYSVFTLDPDNDGIAEDGWAVGANGSIRRGMTWGGFASPTGQQLNSVFMVSANDGWIVGNRSGGGTNQWTILRWNGAAWNPFAVNTGVAARNLNSVYCMAMDDCWAVGDQRGCTNPGFTILRWNGLVWACQGVPAAADEDLNSVSCVTSRDCWAVGDVGTILHWDGNSWTQVASPTGQLLRSVSIIGPRQRPQAAWQEVIQ